MGQMRSHLNNIRWNLCICICCVVRIYMVIWFLYSYIKYIDNPLSLFCLSVEAIQPKKHPAIKSTNTATSAVLLLCRTSILVTQIPSIAFINTTWNLMTESVCSHPSCIAGNWEYYHSLTLRCFILLRRWHFIQIVIQMIWPDERDNVHFDSAMYDKYMEN